MELIAYGLIFLFGICLGSFINMLQYRTAVDYGLIDEGRKFKVKNKQRSYCDGCGKQLSWRENIPIVSWCLQKGKTVCCRKKLPLSYPLVELVTGISFVCFFKIFFGNDFLITDWKIVVSFVVGLVVIVFLLFSAVFDLKYMILPDFSTVLLTGCAAILLLVVIQGRPQESPLQNIIAALSAGGFLLLLYLITRGRGMGLGDVKLAFFMGLFLGGYKTIIAFYFAFIAGALVGICLIIARKAGRNSLIPFGPFLIAGTVTAWWWGDFVINLIKSSL